MSPYIYVTIFRAETNKRMLVIAESDNANLKKKMRKIKATTYALANTAANELHEIKKQTKAKTTEIEHLQCAVTTLKSDNDHLVKTMEDVRHR